MAEKRAMSRAAPFKLTGFYELGVFEKMNQKNLNKTIINNENFR